MRDVRVFLRRARLKAAWSLGARDSGLKRGILKKAAFLKGALSGSELLIPKAFKKASKKESRSVSRRVNYLQIMKNVNFTRFKVLIDPLINNPLEKIYLRKIEIALI